VGLADSVASGFELVLVLCCLVLLAPAARRPLVGRRTHPVAGSGLVLFAAPLIALGLLSAVGVAASVLPPAA
jgi:hypothetical protein